MTGVGGHIRLVLRRDRWLLPLWILIFGCLPLSYASSIQEAFPTQKALDGYAASMSGTPSMVAMYGPMYDASVGQVAAWRSFVVIAFVALVSLLVVIRHTRTEEDAGRRELLGSTVTGRSAPLVAALIVVAVADLLVGLLVAGSLSSIGLSTDGALAFGLSMTTIGWLFAAIGGLCAQLTEGAGGARAIGIAVLAAMYVVRMIGDVQDSWLSWLSPLGWITRTRPFANEEWWVQALPIACTIVVAAVALVVLARRDVGAGIVPPRLGKPEATASLSGPVGLAWRGHRMLLVGWLGGFALLGLALGGVAGGVDTMMADNPQMQQFLERLGGTAGLVDIFVAAMLNILAAAVAAYGIQAANRMRTEESVGHAEPVLATAVSRMRWIGSHVLFGLAGPLLATVVLGLAVGLSVGQAVGDVSGELPRILAAALAQLPAIWILPAIAIALFGVLPKLAGVAWGFLVAFLLLGQFGAVLDLPTWMLDLSPFSHIPRLPGGDYSSGPLIVLTAIALGLTLVGLIGFRRRDLTTA